MWAISPLKTVVWPHLLKKSLIGNFIFCAVSESLMNVRFLKISSLLQLLLNSEQFEAYFRGILEKSYAGKFRQIHRKTSKCLGLKVAIIKNNLHNSCLPVISTKLFLRKPVTKKIFSHCFSIQKTTSFADKSFELFYLDS